MKLDPRIEKVTLIYTPFSVSGDHTMNALHEKGYFSNNIEDFSNLKNCYHGVLSGIIDGKYPFCKDASSDVVDEYKFRFYIPESSLSLKKEYRPYTVAEFQDIFKIGLPVRYRIKDQYDTERLLIFNGYEGVDENVFVYFGKYSYSLDDLFNYYEWQEHYTEDFKPFGVEE